MKHPQVTVIVLNFNGLEDTRTCIKNLLKTTYPNFKVTIVDNGSATNEAKILQQEFHDSRLNFRRFNTNRGFSGGNNAVMKRSKSPYLALVNNDVIVKQGWLSPIISFMERQKDVAVVQPKILWAYDRRYFDYAGATGGFIDFLGYPFTRGRIFSSLEPDLHQYDTQTDIFWSSGATLVLRRSILKEVGYMDETFFNYMEEIDLCYRILQSGQRIVYEPKSVVYHRVASTAGRNSTKKRYLEHRNNLLLIVKNFPTVKLISVLPIRLAMEVLSIFYYLSIARIDFAYAVVQSLASFLFLLPRYIKKRGKIRHNVKAQLGKLIYPSSIAFTYFIHKKKTFREVVRYTHWRPFMRVRNRSL